MIRACNLTALSALFASGKAKAEKAQPVISVVEETFDDEKLWIHFQVSSSKGAFYNCFAGENEQGEFWVACGCRAGLEKKACYHGYAALQNYIYRAENIKLDKAETSVSVDEMRNAPYFSGGDSSNKKPEKIGKIRI